MKSKKSVVELFVSQKFDDIDAMGSYHGKFEMHFGYHSNVLLRTFSHF